MADFNKLSLQINEWLKYNESIDKLNSHIKTIKSKKSTLEQHIIYTLEENNLTDKKLRIGNSHIHYNITHSMPPLSLKLLESVLNEYLTPQLKEKILEKIQSIRESMKSQSVSLKKKNANRKKSSRTKLL
jgi:hypothetical protein